MHWHELNYFTKVLATVQHQYLRIVCTNLKCSLCLTLSYPLIISIWYGNNAKLWLIKNKQNPCAHGLVHSFTIDTSTLFHFMLMVPCSLAVNPLSRHWCCLLGLFNSLGQSTNNSHKCTSAEYVFFLLRFRRVTLVRPLQTNMIKYYTNDIDLYYFLLLYIYSRKKLSQLTKTLV